MSLPPHEALSVLRGLHVSLERSELAVAACMLGVGFSSHEIAQQLRVADSTARGYIADLEAYLFDAVPLEATAWLVSKWQFEHRSCCASPESLGKHIRGLLSDRSALLEQCHYTGLTRRQLQILAAVELGYPVERIAEGIGIAPKTAYRHIGLLQSRIFERCPIEPNHVVLAAWVRTHFPGCTAACLILGQTNQIFEQPVQQLSRRTV